MNCRKCGGELLFQNGISVCQNCGSTFSLDSIYENIDVYICYVENDASGRRTKDSIIAQQVYKKLEDAKISTFYERITAASIGGDDLESIRYAAIQKAKAVLVLGASVENFNRIAEKYDSYFEGKIVIPFCVDINPGSIPKTLGKMQAIDYSAIGWEKNLINGLYNLLGREKDVDVTSLYADTRKKWIIAISIVLVASLLIGVAAFFVFGLGDQGNDSNSNSQVATQSQPVTPKETYDKAMDLLNQEQFVAALDLFCQIPEHANSGNMIKQIYAKYEGYYKSGDTSIHIEISDNVRADIEISITTQDKLIKIGESATVSVNNIAFDYADNHNNTGKAKIQLEDSGIRLELTSNSQTGNANHFFALDEKSDQSFVKVDAQTLMNWLKNEFTLDQIKASGYDLEYIGGWVPNVPEYAVYKIEGTDIYLPMESQKLCRVAAPAEIIAPSLIGKESEPVFEDNVIYYPNAIIDDDSDAYLTGGIIVTSDAIIGEKTMIAINIVPDSAE